MTGPGPLGAVLVVVPVRDEEELLPSCLAALGRSVERLRGLRDGLDVAVAVVLDGCTDGSRAVADRYPVTVVEQPGAGVGAARRAGVDALAAGHAPHRTWLACTDADSVVPEHWLARHVELAEAGADVVVGTVRPRMSELSADRVAVWQARHVPGAANGHVHGANLGVRLDAYRAAGGFARLPEHEDVALVDALRSAGAHVVADAGCEVLTSARLVGRTPGGYARHLREDLVADDDSSYRQDLAG